MIMERWKDLFNVIALSLVCFSNYSQAWHEMDPLCGTRPSMDGPQTRIFNGRDAAPGAWPWVGRMIPRPESISECIVVLISLKWAITPRYCVLPNIKTSARDIRVVFGDNEIDGSSPYRQEKSVRRGHEHPQANFIQNNFALLQLDSPINMTDYVRPICLSPMPDEWETYESCWIAGWGFIDPTTNELPQYLQEAPARILSDEQCGQYMLDTFNITYDETFLCTSNRVNGANGEPHTCEDDGGAPLMCLEANGRWYLIGQWLTYFGSCGDSTTQYSRYSPLFDYFREHIRRVEDCNGTDFRCSDNITCALEEELCDGEPLCLDAEDEINNCTGPVCNEGTCLNGGTCAEKIGGGDYVCRCTEGWTGRNCHLATCGRTKFRIQPGETVDVQSPLYPEMYPPSIECEYIAIVPDGYRVLLEPKVFQVWYFDSLNIDNLTFSGPNIVDNYTTPETTLTIRFETTNVAQDMGFWFQLSAINVTGLNECEWEPCENDGNCTDLEDGYFCECIDERLDNRKCITPDDFCGPQEIDLEEGSSYNLSSFHYYIPNTYNIAYGCKYTVTVPEGHKVRVEVIDGGFAFPYETIILDNNVFKSAAEYISESKNLEIAFRVQGFGFFNLALSDYAELDVDECETQPCLNGGVCLDQIDGFVCKCRRGFTGKTCNVKTGSRRCPKQSFTCNNGRCIKASDVCDGRNHCGDRSDELNCDCDFHCYNGRCIPQRFVCDKDNNCGDWTDENVPQC